MDFLSLYLYYEQFLFQNSKYLDPNADIWQDSFFGKLSKLHIQYGHHNSTFRVSPPWYKSDMEEVHANSYDILFVVSMGSKSFNYIWDGSAESLVISPFRTYRVDWTFMNTWIYDFVNIDHRTWHNCICSSM